jgi:hypothetical protein
MRQHTTEEINSNTCNYVAILVKNLLSSELFLSFGAWSTTVLIVFSYPTLNYQFSLHEELIEKSRTCRKEVQSWNLLQIYGALVKNALKMLFFQTMMVTG